MTTRIPKMLLLDAGNTLIYLDHNAVADVVTSHGVEVDGRVLARVEGDAKRRYESMMQSGVGHEEGWGMYLRSLLEAAGVGSQEALRMVAPLRRTHDAMNLWRGVPNGLREALDRWKASGRRLGVVSNSEGKLPEIFERVGLAGLFEVIVDSHHEGVRKPDPELFRRALSRTHIDAADAVYLGDIPGVDVVGAESAGIEGVLVDTLGFYPTFSGRRVTSVQEYVDAMLA